VDGGRIIDKAKIHLLVHLPEDIKNHGPAIRYETEVFECYNAIFQLCSVLSNHQAPSHDIARKCAKMEHVKHILSGGYWPGDGEHWVQAGPGIQETLATNDIIQRHLGWSPPQHIIPGVSESFVHFHDH
jgi:hypothetical protein